MVDHQAMRHIKDWLCPSHTLCGQPVAEVYYWNTNRTAFGGICPRCERAVQRRRNGLMPGPDEVILQEFFFSEISYKRGLCFNHTIMGKIYSFWSGDGIRNVNFPPDIVCVHRMYANMLDMRSMTQH